MRTTATTTANCSPRFLPTTTCSMTWCRATQHIPEDANKYLQRLEIAHKVSVKDGSFTTTDLSTGQRKRLALVNAWLEERPVLVFDEWAADQDPTFRRIFYTELLPDLKRLGKTIIVISHDDRYFDMADQLVRMESGRVVTERGHRLSAVDIASPRRFFGVCFPVSPR